MTSFPGALDTFQNPSASTSEDAAGFEHDVQHANINDAVRALQTKVGIDGSADQNSLDAKVSKMVALLLADNSISTVKLVISGGQVMLVIYDQVLNQYSPLVLSDGSLGVGAPISI